MEPVSQPGSLIEPPADRIGDPDADSARQSLGPASRKSAGMGLWLRDLLVSAAASVLIITFLYQPVRVEGTSMLPRLEDHDRLFINKFVYHITAIERGDVVVFHYPRDPEKSYIKRVIALPGDRSAHRSRPGLGQRQAAARDLCSRGVPRQPLHGGDGGSRGRYFMMGDHRSISSDSREFGPVDRSLIYGKAVFVYWPARDAGVVR